MAELTTPDPARAQDDIREVVREKYAAAARAAADADATRCGCGAGAAGVFGSALYDDGDADGATPSAVSASLGCGVPTAVADLHEGETVLDLGSGAGADVLISARRVGASGRAIGLDMTDEMLDLARANAAQAGVRQRRVRQGLHRGHPAPRRVGRRRDLQLRDQPRRPTRPRCWPRPRACCGPAGASRSPT